MKKLLAVAAAATVLSSSAAFAQAEDIFYIKGNIGASKLNRVTDKISTVKLKSKTAAFFGIGGGYHIMDNMRADLMVEYYASPVLKKKDQGKHNPKITTVMLNSFVDLGDVSIAKIFVGAGIGIANVKEKITDNTGATASVKGKNNFAYALTVGAASEVSEGVNAELSYSWKDFGKTKSQKSYTFNGTKIDGTVERSKTAYKGHHFTFGFRFDI